MTSDRYSWVPDHHLAVAASLSHADEVIAHVADILYGFQSRPDGIIDLGEIPMMNYSETVVLSIPPLPRKVPLLVADALVALRNAIEHTLFAEIEFRDGVLKESVARLIEMPAAKSYDAFDGWVRKLAKNGPPSLRRGSELLTRIEGLQPFQRTVRPEEHPMALLTLHTNHSKHRAAAVAAVRLAAIHRDDVEPSAASVERLPELPLQVGDVIARTPHGVQVPVALFPAIGLNRPGTDRWPVLMKELDDLATWVRTQAVPRLITGQEPLQPVLPPRYEISVSSIDDRNALSSGAVLSAAETYRDRLEAATARPDLVDMIRHLDDAPEAQQITEWLQSLSDQDVLARVRRLSLTLDYTPEAVLHNVAVLETCREEARQFAGLSRPHG